MFRLIAQSLGLAPPLRRALVIVIQLSLFLNKVLTIINYTGRNCAKHMVPVQEVHTTEDNMTTQIMTYCRYICLSVLAALLVTGVPGESRALSSADISEGEAFGSADVVDAYAILPYCFMRTGQKCLLGNRDLRCVNENGQQCWLSCQGSGKNGGEGPPPEWGDWGEPHSCGRRGPQYF